MRAHAVDRARGRGRSGPRGRRSSCPGRRAAARRGRASTRRRRRCRRRRARRAGARQPPLPTSGTLSAKRTLPSALRAARLRTRPSGRGELVARLELQPEHRAVEQRRLVEVVERLRQRDVVDPGHVGGGAGARRAGGEEVGEPAVGVGGVGAAEEHRRAVGRGDRGEVRLVGAALARQQRGEQPLGALGRARRVGALDRDRRDARAGLGMSSWLTRMWVSPWRQSCTSLVRWCPAWRNPIAISSRSTADARSRRDRQLGEGVPAQRRGGRQPRQARRLLEQEQRAHRVDGHAAAGRPGGTRR